MNSVGELVETSFSRINIEDTYALAEALESWKWASGGASLPNDPRRQKACDLPIVKKNWDNMLLVADQVSKSQIFGCGTERERGLAQCFASFIAWNWTTRVLE